MAFYGRGKGFPAVCRAGLPRLSKMPQRGAQLNAVVFNIQSGLNFYPVAPEDGTGVSKKTSVAYLSAVFLEGLSASGVADLTPNSFRFIQ